MKGRIPPLTAKTADLYVQNRQSIAFIYTLILITYEAILFVLLFRTPFLKLDRIKNWSKYGLMDLWIQSYVQ